jgi:glutathione peroxidase
MSAGVPSSFYALSARTLRGEMVRFDQYAGSVVLIANTASRCGFSPQYAGLEKLYRNYQARGLRVIGFPCNQFGSQEPDSGPSIETACRLNYGVSFPILEKCDVHGPLAHPVFQWLTGNLPGWLGRDVRWNFTKFLIDRWGNPVARYAPVTRPEKLQPVILELLSKKA